MTQFLTFVRNPRRWWLVLALVVIAGAGWIAYSAVSAVNAASAASRVSPQEGFFAPDFTLASLDGQPVKLSSLRGKAVVVNLWASWCPPCQAELPAFVKAYEVDREGGLEVLAVNATDSDTVAAASASAQRLGLSFPVLLDTDGVVGKLYHLRALPTTVFIDRRGVIRSIVVGQISEPLLNSKIEDLLRERT